MMITYKFLVFSLLFLIPGMIIYLTRTDLRPVIHVMALASIPFAFTEWLFYPAYWEPVFLFDLVNIIGFGIEDLIFVVGLSAFSSTAYAFFSKKTYSKINPPETVLIGARTLVFLMVVFSLVGLVFLLEIEMIYGSVGIMLGSFVFILFRRRDLIGPGISGGCATLAIYTTLCLLINRIYPAIFELTWHTEQFSNIYILGIPIEEILYGTAAGCVATVFYPYLFKAKFVSTP